MYPQWELLISPIQTLEAGRGCIRNCGNDAVVVNLDTSWIEGEITEQEYLSKLFWYWNVLERRNDFSKIYQSDDGLLILFVQHDDRFNWKYFWNIFEICIFNSHWVILKHNVKTWWFWSLILEICFSYNVYTLSPVISMKGNWKKK